MDINYPEMIIQKSEGVTESETRLSKLCNKLFLSLWSYPNVYRDQGQGKEICDLLVVFNEHLFIFSDKECRFETSEDLNVNWSRWYQRTIYNSAKQIWGAERWIFDYPKRIFIDKKCTKHFPLSIPSKSEAIIHRIVVAHGAKEECQKHFKGGSGSLILKSDVIGEMHTSSLFTIGQIEPDRGFIHVFDDITLEVIMQELDTITDFVQYLIKKEELIVSGKLLAASGEEELLAVYLSNRNSKGEHFFISPEAEHDFLAMEEGLWRESINLNLLL